MAMARSAVLAALLSPGVLAQQAGKVVQESAPPMPLGYCTTQGGCTSEPAAVTLDANWRWVHEAEGYTSCITEGRWESTFCPDGANCAKNCAVEGVDLVGYESVYGVRSIPTGLEMQFVSDSGTMGSRVYMTDGADEYKMFKLKNREFTFDVDVSTLPCGMNGALYFIEMDKLGGKGTGHNNAGAKYGTGYCDAQCPHDIKWMDGKANVDGVNGICCFEMDIWEANRMATAFTPHPCAVDGPFICEGRECGDGDKGERYIGVCDKDGCDLNTYRMGATMHYGQGAGYEVDTDKVMTVVTQFITENNSDVGDLVRINRLYIQDGKVIRNGDSLVPGAEGDSITDDFCSGQKAAFGDPDDHRAKGGLKNMGEALDRGMVLALSIWADGATEMRWLDAQFPVGESSSRPGVLRGPCDGSTSNPMYLRSEHADATVKYMNIRYGEIGSTVSPDGRRLGDIIV